MHRLNISIKRGSSKSSVSRGRLRQKAKLDHLSYVISRFGYTTKYHFTKILDLKPRSQERFVTWLVENNYVRLFKFSIYPEPLIIPKKAYVDLLKETHPESKVPTSNIQRISERMINHTLFQQEVLAFDFDTDAEYVTDRMMTDGLSKRPDVIVNNKHAIEAELSVKGKTAMTKAFLNLLMGINKGHYEDVTYYSNTEYMHTHLTRIFNQKKWLIPQSKGVSIEKVISPEIKSKIKFKLIK